MTSEDFIELLTEKTKAGKLNWKIYNNGFSKSIYDSSTEYKVSLISNHNDEYNVIVDDDYLMIKTRLATASDVPIENAFLIKKPMGKIKNLYSTIEQYRKNIYQNNLDQCIADVTEILKKA